MARIPIIHFGKSGSDAVGYLQVEIEPGDLVHQAPSVENDHVSLEEGASKGLNRFFEKGAVWEVSFAGISTSVRHSAGMGYIASLLKKKGVEVPALELASGGVRHGAILQERDKAGLALSSGWSSQQTNEGLTQSQIRKLERSLDDEEIISTHGEEAVEELKKRIVGRRQFIDEADKARQRVGHAIRTSLQNLQKCHPTLAAHLRDSLVTPSGHTPKYAPAKSVTWVFE